MPPRAGRRRAPDNRHGQRLIRAPPSSSRKTQAASAPGRMRSERCQRLDVVPRAVLGAPGVAADAREHRLRAPAPVAQFSARRSTQPFSASRSRSSGVPVSGATLTSPRAAASRRRGAGSGCRWRGCGCAGRRRRRPAGARRAVAAGSSAAARRGRRRTAGRGSPPRRAAWRGAAARASRRRRSRRRARAPAPPSGRARLPQHARPVGRPGGRGVERRDDVVAGRVAPDLAHHVLRDLLRRDELHQPERGERLELRGAEEAVLAGVQVDARRVSPVSRQASPAAPRSAKARSTGTGRSRRRAGPAGRRARSRRSRSASRRSRPSA
jgi:hypothetical protein